MKSLSVFLASAALVCGMASTSHALYSTNQITTNGGHDTSVQTNSNGDAVWMGVGGTDGGTDYEVFYYDSATQLTSQVTQNSNDDTAPQLNDAGEVVYMGYDGADWDVYLWLEGDAVNTATNLSDANSNDDGSPQINASGHVTWYGNDGTDWEIYLYLGVLPATNISNNGTYDSPPQINDNDYVVWYGAIGDNEIFIWDNGVTGTPVNISQNSGKNDTNARINNNNVVVWRCNDGTDNEICMYDGAVTVLTDNTDDDGYPQIDVSDNVVWEGTGGTGATTTDYEIFRLDAATTYTGDTVNAVANTTQVTDNSNDDIAAQIAAGNVAWQGNDGSDWEIFLDDGSITQLTSNTDADDTPVISIVSAQPMVGWQGTGGVDSGSDYEIFLTDFVACSVTEPGTELSCYDGQDNDCDGLTDGVDPDCFCGNSTLDAGEDCEDGNQTSLDGCSSTCTIESTGYTNFQITDNLFNDNTPQVNASGQIVWSGFDGTYYQIQKLNGSIVTVNAAAWDQIFPQINATGKVAYEGDSAGWNIFEDAAQVSSSPIDNGSVRMCGIYTIWVDGNGEIILNDADISTSPAPNSAPQVNCNGDAVWVGGDGEIYFNNTAITTTTTANATPQINLSNGIVWSGFDGNDYEIMFSNAGAVATPVTANYVDDQMPQMNDIGDIVWMQYDGNDYEIILDNGTAIQLTNNDNDDLAPQINASGNVAWESYDGLDWEIIFMNGTFIFPLTDNALQDRSPMMGDNEEIVWMQLDGNDWEVIVGTFGTCGNGITEGREECDDGNDNDYDTCTNTCVNQTVAGPWEICGNSIDDDGDGDTDEAMCLVDGTQGTSPCTDGDGDGYILWNDNGSSIECLTIDAPIDVFECADDDAGVNDDVTAWYEDFDGDLAGNPNVMLYACAQPAGYVADNSDCDDIDPLKPVPNGCDYFLYFPKIKDSINDPYRSWMSFQNLDPAVDADLTIYIYDPAGNPVCGPNTVGLAPDCYYNETVLANGTLQMRIAGADENRTQSITGNITQDHGSMIIVSPVELLVMNQYENGVGPSFSLFANGAPKTTMLFPKAFDGRFSWFNILSVQNIHDTQQQFEVVLTDNGANEAGRQTITLQPYGSWHGRPTDLTDQTWIDTRPDNPARAGLNEFQGSVNVTSIGLPIVALYEYYRFDPDPNKLSIYENVDPINTLYFPVNRDIEISGGPRNWLSLSSPDTQTCTAQLNLYDGTPVATTPVPLVAGQTSQLRPYELAGYPVGTEFQGVMKISCIDAPIVGQSQNEFGGPDSFALVDPGKVEPKLYFPKIFDGRFRFNTVLTVQNTSGAETLITLDMSRDDGVTCQFTDIPVPADGAYRVNPGAICGGQDGIAEYFQGSITVTTQSDDIVGAVQYGRYEGGGPIDRFDRQEIYNGLLAPTATAP